MIGALAVILALGAVPQGPSAGSAPGEILRQDAYRFCHDERFPLYIEEQAWCPLVGERSEVCPALPKACAAPPAQPPAGQARGSGPMGDARGGDARGGDARGGDARGGDARGGDARGGDARGGDARGGDARGDGAGQGSGDGSGEARGSGDARGSGERREIQPRPRPRSDPPSAGMSAFAQILFWALIVAGVAAVAWAIAKALMRHRDLEEGDEPAAPADAETKTAEPRRAAPVETDVARLLARARAAAANGDYERALADTYAALLRRLDGDGFIEIHPFYTNGDYLRALRERSDLREAIRAIFRDVERVQFGAEPPSRTLFQSVYDRVVPLATRSLGALALCFFIAAAGTSCGGHVADASGGAADAVSGADPVRVSGSASPSGTRALSELLARRGVESRHRTEPLKKLGDERIAIVLLDAMEVEQEEWDELFAWVEDRGGVLVVAGASALPPRSGVRETIADDRTQFIEIDPRQPLLRDNEIYFAAPNDRGLAIALEDDGPIPLLRRGSSIYASYERRGSGSLIVFTDAELFRNIAFTVAGNADGIATLLASFHRPVHLCDSWTGAGASTPLESVSEAKLTPLILQLLLVAALLLLWKGMAFGTLRDPPEASRRAFADHARALGLHYARASASQHVLGQYASWAIERLRDRTHRGTRGGIVPLAEAVAARTGQSEAEVVEVLVEAQGARDAAGPPSFRNASRRVKTAASDEARDLALMRALTGFLAVTQGGSGTRTQGNGKQDS